MSWIIDPNTGDYVMSGGAPTESEALIYPAFYRLKVRRTQWMYAPDSSYGSDFYTLKKRFTALAVNPTIGIAEKALEPLVEEGLASEVIVTQLPSSGRNDIQMDINLVDAQGEEESLLLPMVGGS